jgi:phosphatidylinositol glycan class B
MTQGNKQLFYICVSLSTLVFLLSACLNFCYLQPDEYYQIVEFASFKMGITPASSLAWEYAAKVRPGLQPLMAYEIFRSLDIIHITDHYTQLFILRILSAAFTLFTIVVFCLANIRLLTPSYHRLYIIVTFLFWSPYLFGVRFASESWAGGCMLLASALIVYLESGNRKKNRNILYAITGTLLGLAFLFRFQTAFFSIGIGAWLLFIRREKLIPIICLISGVIVSLAIGSIADRWLYGEWTCSAWSYFQSNILQGVAAEFGTKPFYTYFFWFLTLLSPGIGILTIFCLLFLIIKLPKSIYTWTLLPFLLAHSLIGHKEWRFMFPMLLYLPIVCVLVFQYMREKQSLMIGRKTKIAVVSFILLCNFLFLFIFVIGAHFYSNDPKNFGLCIHALAKTSRIDILYTDPEAHPYILPHSRYKSNIYPGYLSEVNIFSTKLSSWDALTLSSDENKVRLISANKYELEHDPKHASYSGEIIASTLPLWIQNLNAGQSVKEELDKNTYLIIKLDK